MKKSTMQLMSFVSGLTLAAVVIGVTLSKSPALRGEIESQLNTILKTTRVVVDSYKRVATKSKSAANLIRNDADVMTEREEAEINKHAKETNSMWDAMEANAS